MVPNYFFSQLKGPVRPTGAFIHVQSQRCASLRTASSRRAFSRFPLLLILLGVFADQPGVLPPALGPSLSEIDSLPSTTAVDPAEVETGLPLLSLWVDPDNLHDPLTGILTNTLGTGRSWERPGFCLVFRRCDASLRHSRWRAHPWRLESLALTASKLSPVLP